MIIHVTALFGETGETLLAQYSVKEPDLNSVLLDAVKTYPEANKFRFTLNLGARPKPRPLYNKQGLQIREVTQSEIDWTP